MNFQTHSPSQSSMSNSKTNSQSCIFWLSWKPLFQQPSFSFRRKEVWDVEKISGKLFAWIANSESKSMLSRFTWKRNWWDTIFRVISKTRGVRETLKCGHGKQDSKSGWYSVQLAPRSLKHACLGKPRVPAKSRSEHERPNQTRWKHHGNIDEFREDAHFDVDAIYGFIDAGGTAHGPELRKHQRVVRDYKYDDRRNFRN